jgi:hypothetical protein
MGEFDSNARQGAGAHAGPSRRTKMAEKPMPPQWTGKPEHSDPKDAEGHVAAAAVPLVRDRVSQ